MKHSIPGFRFRTPGFTLAELLVSMAILSGLILLLFSIVDQTTHIWSTSEQRVDAFREARAALYTIARDLESVISSPDADVDGAPDFNYFFVNPARTGVTDVTFTGVAEDAEGDRLFFLTSQSLSSQGNAAKNETCSVGYYLDYVPGQPNAFKLFRYFMNSNETFARLKDYTSGTSTVLMQASSATNECLARNVIYFSVTAYDNSMTAVSPWQKDHTPAAIELSITAYSYTAANSFASRSDWLDVTSPRNRRSKQTFTTRISLP